MRPHPRPYTYDRRRQAGGIDVTEDVTKLLPGLAGALGTFTDEDIAHGTYAFDYIAGYSNESKVATFAGAIATEYARRFAGWLGYVFLNRANLSRASKEMKSLTEAMGNWIEILPDIITGKAKPDLSEYLPAGEAGRFLDPKVIDAIGAKVIRVVRQDWMQHGTRMASDLEKMPIIYNPTNRHYEIPKSSLTYTNRNKLRALGFDYDRVGEVWFADSLDSRALDVLPQAANLKRGPAPAPAQIPTGDPKDWFFEQWLPSNISRFDKIFNEYGRAKSVPYKFKFIVRGTEVTVMFNRGIDTIPEAIAELKARYGGAGDRDGWMLAVEAYFKLQSASGRSAIRAVDAANDLEHSHGAMMEHFPPGVRQWYPAFLDFKFSAHIWQVVRAIKDEDLRVVCQELLPIHDRMERMVTPKIDHRTPRGLALEVSSQPGKAAKKKMLLNVKEYFPEMYGDVVALLEERGLTLT